MSRKNPIPKPWKAILDPDRNCIRFWFNQASQFFPTDQSVDFYVRGAVCWPATISSGSDQATEGCFLLAGQDLRTGCIYIFEQVPFVCVDHIIEPGSGRIQYEGVSPVLKFWNARYYVDTYYWHDHTDTHTRYLLQLVRSPYLDPKPWFAEVVWYDDEQAKQALWEKISHGRLVHWAGENPERDMQEPLYRGLMLFRDEGKVLPAAKAAMTLMMGYERYPWRSDV